MIVILVRLAEDRPLSFPVPARNRVVCCSREKKDSADESQDTSNIGANFQNPPSIPEFVAIDLIRGLRIMLLVAVPVNLEGC